MRLKPVPSAVTLLAVLAAATGVSRAQTGITTGTATGTTTGGVSASDFTFLTEYYDKNQGIWVQMNDTQRAYFFNRARCECAGDTGDGSNYSGYFRIAVLPAAGTTAQKIQNLLLTNGFPLGDARFYAGANGINCLNVASYTGSLSSVCTNLENPTSGGYNESFPLSDFATKQRVESKPIAVSTLFGSLKGCGNSGNCNDIGPCSTTGFQTQTIYFWARTSGKDTPDSTDISFTLNLNGELQYTPTNVYAKGGNDALVVNWDWPAGITPSADASFLGVQVFCQRAEGYQVFPGGSFGASYMQSAALCPAAGPVISSPSAFSNLNPLFLCSGLLPSTAKSYRITGLQNDIWYGVGVAAVDKYGNFSNVDPEFDVAYGKPIATVDFYTNYRNEGGQAQGGFCSLGGWQARTGGLVSIALLALGLLVIARARRKGPPGTTTKLLLVVVGVLASSRAQALGNPLDDMSVSADRKPQPEPEPKQEEPPRPAPTWAGTPRNFAIELRFSLYHPNVDSEFGPKPDGAAASQPNQFMFGDSGRPMWQLEFDWEFLQKLGTLSVGASVGYWKENGQACLKSDLEATGKCTRTGDATSLRLIPFAAVLVYRMDEAAKRWRIPLVPYGKIGLNYTIWTVNDGNGNVPNYPRGGHGQGGTAGWQAAIGLALQLDFLDPAAAHEFDADIGVNHTYAFFELDHVNGSGLYRSDVLQVGDNTWSAGLMFEF